MRAHLILVLALVLLCFGGQTVLAGDCYIGGDITAVPNPDPLGPTWQYTLVITWNTGTPYALSHMDLLLDSVGGACTLADFQSILTWEDPIGTSDGEGGCLVPYLGELSDNGDPSIPNVSGILLKFEPIEEGCEPDTVGTSTFVFYSNLAPVPVDEDILSLVDKFALNYCFGYLTGMFPGMDCDPVPDESTSWGSVKGLYR